MPNPFFDNRTSPNNVTEPNNPLNDDSKDYSRGFSTFDFGRNFFNTLRYADITPHEVVEAGMCKDKLPFGSKHEVRSHTLSSVIMSDIFMKKSYFAVDYRSFLPLQWSKILTHPINGDDIEAVRANTTIEELHYCLYNLCVLFADNHRSLDSFNSDNDKFVWQNAMIHALFLLECFLSNGSLLSTLGFHGSTMLVNQSFDKLFDNLISDFVNSDTGFYIYNDGTLISWYSGADEKVTVHYLLDYMRHHYEEDFYMVDSSYEDLVKFFNTLKNAIATSEFSDNVPFNYSRVCAYKMVVSQFYTNDKVDSIFTNHMWLENQDWIWRKIFNGYEAQSEGEDVSIYDNFLYNGIRCQYDVLSGNKVSVAFNYLYLLESFMGVSDSIKYDESSFKYASNFLYNLFSFDSSLRYGDYYTGAKTRPVAIGDTELVEVGEGVSTIEAVRRFSITRFLNQVGRVGSRTIDYVRGVLKGVPAPDVTIPRFLASSTSSISGFEVENTSQNQGDIVTLLKSSDSNYIYEVEVGEPCIIIGLTTFEVPRIYSKSSDKFFFHVDRFDMFNPFLENTGDQEINLYERSLSAGRMPFAYTGRYMEYKQRVPYACGGFVDFLPSWLFITDNDLGDYGDDTQMTSKIDEYFIRSKNSEMDRFYSSLTGYSLASYFHFIVKYQNFCNATRQMQYNPQLM